MASIDNVLTDLKNRINQLDKDIRELLRTQTDAGQQAFLKLEETKKLITVKHQLFFSIFINIYLFFFSVLYDKL